MDSKKIKILIIVFIVIAVLFILMSILKGGEAQPLITSENISVSDGVQDKEVLGLLLNLKSIKLDIGLFSDKLFRGLEDFGVELPDEPKQRSNPFAPIGSEEVVNIEAPLEGDLEASI